MDGLGYGVLEARGFSSGGSRVLVRGEIGAGCSKSLTWMSMAIFRGVVVLLVGTICVLFKRGWKWKSMK